MKITPVIFGVMAESALVGGYKHFETCCQQFRDRRCTEDKGNKHLKKKKKIQPTTNYRVSQNTTTISLHAHLTQRIVTSHLNVRDYNSKMVAPMV